MIYGFKISILAIYFTSLPSFPCQYQTIIESDQPTYQKHHNIALKIGLFFINLVENFKRGRLLERGRLLQKIRYVFYFWENLSSLMCTFKWRNRTKLNFRLNVLFIVTVDGIDK